MINDLRLKLPTYRCVDDMTVYEACRKPDFGHQSISGEIMCLAIFASKTKEIIGKFRHCPNPEPLLIDSDKIERVRYSNLLGLISSDLKWSHHMCFIVAYQTLVLLKRSRLKPWMIIRINTTTIRQILNSFNKWKAPCNNVLSRLNMFHQNEWQSAKW